VLTDEHSTKASGRGHLDDGLRSDIVMETTVAANDQRLTFEAFQRGEDRSDKILQVVRLLKDRHLLAKTRRAGTLPGKGRGGYLANDRRGHK
jgi:hypothetical protein